MRVSFKRVSNLFSDNMSGRIKKIDGSVLTYEIICEVSIAQAVLLGLSKISVSITSPSVKNNARILSVMANKRPSSVIAAIGSARNNMKIRAASSGPDIITKSSASVSTAIAGKSLAFTRSILKTGTYAAKKKIIFGNVSNSQAISKAGSSFVNESRFESSEFDQSLSYDAAVLELISQGQDVTEAIDFRRVDRTTRENTQGLVEKSRILVKRTDGRQQDVVQSLMQSTRAGFVPISRLQGDTLPTEAYVTTQYRQFKFEVTIDQNLPGVGSRFIAHIDAKDSKGIVVATETLEVINSDALRDFYTPRDVVRMHVNRVSTGFFCISVTTTDPNIRSCDIFARSLSEGIQTSYDKIATIDLEPLTGQRVVNIDSDSGIIFRCVPISRAGQAVANTSGDSLISRDLSTSFAVLYSRLDRDGIILETNNIYGDVSELAILRRDVTLKEKTFSTIAKNPVNKQGSIYKDTSVKVGHLYEYRCEMFNRFSKKSGLSNSRFEEFVYNIGEVIVSATVSQVNSSNVTINTAVSGTLDTSTQQLFTQISQFDGTSVFQEKFKQIYNSFSSISLVRVERFDTTTGETREIGIFKPGLVKDNPVGSGLFKYRIEALTRAPADLLEEIATADTIRLANTAKSQNLSAAGQLSQTSQRLNFTQKFVNKYSLNKGTLSYSSIQAQNHTESAIEQGKTGVTAVISVEIPSLAPRISPLDIRGLPDGRNILRWRVENPDLLDHFLVTCTRSGTDFACGIAQAIPGETTVTFIDFVTNNFVGSCTYKVTPVGLNFVPGPQLIIGKMLMGEMDAG